MSEASTAMLLKSILTELEGVRDALLAQGSDARSSVQVNTSTRGWDITCKAYAGSDIEPAGNAAVSEYLRVRQMLEDALMGKAAA